MRYAALIILILITVILPVTAESGAVSFRGGDWTAGTNTTYCGIYWPHLDAYCQSGH